MKFYLSSNNGVIAVIREDHAQLYGTVKNAGGDPIAAGCRVFTFCSNERMATGGVAERMVFTGTHDDLDHLIKVGNHRIMRSMGHSQWDGYVPFSNGLQYGCRLGFEGQEGGVSELRYVTKLHDIIEVFGTNALMSQC